MGSQGKDQCVGFVSGGVSVVEERAIGMAPCKNLQEAPMAPSLTFLWPKVSQ